jgi:anti-sigma factor RsiW
MTPLEPGELSAYLDGELGSERMREVENIIASDPIVRAEFDALASADRNWRASARSAAFHPKVDLSRASAAPSPRNAISMRGVFAFVAVLIIMQIVLRKIDIMTLTLALNGVAFTLVLFCVISSSNQAAARNSIWNSRSTYS